MIYCLGPLAALVDRKVFYECLDDNDELTLGKNRRRSDTLGPFLPLLFLTFL